ncbi:lipid-A-disaccharide synthase N-terminal domain-containing protein [Desulfolithobacter sp.]
MDKETIWLVIGFLGQACFTCRFLVQWLASERQKKSIIPLAFWYFSIVGGAILFSYAVYRKDPVFILGQSTGLLIYFRNLHFIRKEERVRSYARA